jgi:KDO2-lipid IV(A) lauroyltransferase
MAKRRLTALFDAPIGVAAAGLLRLMKRADRRRSADFAGALFRRIGPLLKEHRIGRDNLRAAFPEKSAAEIEKILAGVWDNLGRVAVEFAHLDEFRVAGAGSAKSSEIAVSLEARARYDHLMRGGKPMIGFAAHLANWEIPAVGAKLLGIKTAILYRRPNIDAISDLIVKLRTPLMGELIPTALDAPLRLARLLQSGVNVGLLADQHFTGGVEVTFFGRSCFANPLVAMLARQTGCPIHGLRVVRNPDGNSFWGEITEEIDPARGADGRIDLQATTQKITAAIEGWVREHPEQWLWLHRRWR